MSVTDSRYTDPAYRIPCDGDCEDNDPLNGEPSCPGWRIDHERIADEDMMAEIAAMPPKIVAASTALQEFLALERLAGLSKARSAALCGRTPDAVAKWRSGARAVPAYAIMLLRAEVARRGLDGEQS